MANDTYYGLSGLYCPIPFLEICISKMKTYLKLYSFFTINSQVIHAHNYTIICISAYIYSEEHRQIWRFAEEVEAGVVGVNDSAVAIVEGDLRLTILSMDDIM